MEGFSFWDEPTCGGTRQSDYLGLSQRDDEQKGYIVGGRDAFEGEFPWQVRLNITFERYFCYLPFIRKKISDHAFVIVLYYCQLKQFTAKNKG